MPLFSGHKLIDCKKEWHINDYRDTFRIAELDDGLIVQALLAKVENGEGILAKELALKNQWIRNGPLRLLLSCSLSLKSSDKK